MAGAGGFLLGAFDANLLCWAVYLMVQLLQPPLYAAVVETPPAASLILGMGRDTTRSSS